MPFIIGIPSLNLTRHQHRYLCKRFRWFLVVRLFRVVFAHSITTYIQGGSLTRKGQILWVDRQLLRLGIDNALFAAIGYNIAKNSLHEVRQVLVDYMQALRHQSSFTVDIPVQDISTRMFLSRMPYKSFRNTIPYNTCAKTQMSLTPNQSRTYKSRNSLSCWIMVWNTWISQHQVFKPKVFPYRSMVKIHKFPLFCTIISNFDKRSLLSVPKMSFDWLPYERHHADRNTLWRRVPLDVRSDVTIVKNWRSIDSCMILFTSL